MGATPECPWNRVGKKLMEGKKKRVLHPLSLSFSLSPFLCSTERLIRTCHRSNEYHLNCFVYGSEFGCRFNLRMCLSSCARRGGRTESGSPNETPASVTGWRGPTRSDGVERKFWQDGGGRGEKHTHTHTIMQHAWRTQKMQKYMRIMTLDIHLCWNINVYLFASNATKHMYRDKYQQTSNQLCRKYTDFTLCIITTSQWDEHPS